MDLRLAEPTSSAVSPRVESRRTSRPARLERRGGAGGGAVWSLLLPPVRHLLCHAATPPPFVEELVRRGVRVDVVTRCDLEAWARAAPSNPRLRCLWEPDGDVDYDLAVLWDPRSARRVGAWLRSLERLPAPPREIAIWGRNPCRGGPAWPQVDWLLHRAGWRLGASQLALPEPDRVRQIVAWQDYTRTALVRHRRSDRPWKAWLARRALWRWTMPVRLRRAHVPLVGAMPAALDAVLADVGAACSATASLERLLVSPNGVGIARLRVGETQSAILKIPYALAAEGRVARNARALVWLAEHAGRLGAWKQAPPRLLGQGRTAGWNWTLEECAAGSEAQGWDGAAADRAMQVLGGFLVALADLGEEPRPLDGAALAAACGAPVRRAAALVDPDLARRLHALGERLLQSLHGLPVPLVPRHGDFKLENVLGEPGEPERARVLDWELWTPRGLPLLDLWHLVASRRGRDAGCAMGTAVERWLLPRALSRLEEEMVERLARRLDPRYVALSPVLYWLDRIGPVAARGAWPTRHWEQANIAAVLDAVEPFLASR